MPSTPSPIVGNMGVVWTPVVQALQTGKQKAANLAASQQQNCVFDRWMNCVEVSGSNLDQVVTIGAGHLNGGVEVGTGLASGTAGTAVQANLATGTLTVTKLSTAATLESTTAGTFAEGQVIGVIDASDTDLLGVSPATTILEISGSSVTLSQPALDSGSGLYCAACNWTVSS
jgi:hypothetical protein